MPDEYLSLIIKALDNQHTAGQSAEQRDDRYLEAANLFRTAAERKEAAKDKGSVHKKQHGRKTG